MSAIKTSNARIQEVEYPPSNLKGARVEVYGVYTRLATPARRVVDDLLLQHAFLFPDTHSYVLWNGWSVADRRDCSLRLRKKVSPEMADAWFSWAMEISHKGLSVRACRNAILNMLSELVHLKFIEGVGRRCGR